MKYFPTVEEEIVIRFYAVQYLINQGILVQIFLMLKSVTWKLWYAVVCNIAISANYVVFEKVNVNICKTKTLIIKWKKVDKLMV